MRLRRLSVRGFRNLRDADLEFPPGGAAWLGPNGQGKTNLLEAIHYPVLFRSMRGAPDPEVLAFGQAGFRVELAFESGDRPHTAAVSYQQAGRKKRIAVDSAESCRAAEVAGTWLAVAFQPSDVSLASGPAAVRRRYLDRMLGLADRQYLAALLRYRAALEQRNAALRQGAGELARAFDEPLALAGSRLISARLAWVREAADALRAELEGLGESEPIRLEYGGAPGLTAPEAWRDSLERAAGRDRARGMTTVGPHRDDLRLTLGGRALREFGSTGQQRIAAIALRLVELETLRAARRAEPALLLDDVFAELDRERQTRLGRRLQDAGRGQVFLTAPREDELPPEVELPVWRIEAGRVLSDGA